MTCHEKNTFAENKNTRIYLIRHAQSEANSSKHYTGWLDVDLTDFGLRQATLARDYFNDIKMDNIYASSLQRAYKTADIIFGKKNGIEMMDVFKEISIGAFESKTHEELLLEFPEIYPKWTIDPTTTTPPGGETIFEFYKRIVSGLSRVLSENIGKSAAIVSHGGVIRCLVVYALNMNLCDIWKIKVDNVSVSRIEFSGDKKALTLLNDTHHLMGL